DLAFAVRRHHALLGEPLHHVRHAAHVATVVRRGLARALLGDRRLHGAAGRLTVGTISRRERRNADRDRRRQCHESRHGHSLLGCAIVPTCCGVNEETRFSSTTKGRLYDQRAPTTFDRARFCMTAADLRRAAPPELPSPHSRAARSRLRYW